MSERPSGGSLDGSVVRGDENGSLDALLIENAQLRAALQSRIVIEQAKGVLMERERCTPDDAFAILKATSQRSNRKLRLIAGEVVESVDAV